MVLSLRLGWSKTIPKRLGLPHSSHETGHLAVASVAGAQGQHPRLLSRAAGVERLGCGAAECWGEGDQGWKILNYWEKHGKKHYKWLFDWENHRTKWGMFHWHVWLPDITRGCSMAQSPGYRETLAKKNLSTSPFHPLVLLVLLYRYTTPVIQHSFGETKKL